MKFSLKLWLVLGIHESMESNREQLALPRESIKEISPAFVSPFTCIQTKSGLAGVPRSKPKGLKPQYELNHSGSWVYGSRQKNQACFHPGEQYRHEDWAGTV